MRRRSVVAAVATTITGALAGCLGDDLRDTGEDTPPDELDNPVVAYRSLPDTDQAFVDAALDGYTVYWIHDQGEEIALERTNDAFAMAEHPPDESVLSGELMDVLGGEAYLEVEEDRYTDYFEFEPPSIGNGNYAWTLSVTAVDSCDGEVRELDSFDGAVRSVLATLVEEGELLLADSRFEAVAADPDVFAEEDTWWTILHDIAGEEVCVESNDSRYAVSVGTLGMTSMTYRLERVLRDR